MMALPSMPKRGYVKIDTHGNFPYGSCFVVKTVYQRKFPVFSKTRQDRMDGRINRDRGYDERNRYYEKRDHSFRSTTFFVSYVTLNATVVTKNATIHYGTSNPTTAIETA